MAPPEQLTIAQITNQYTRRELIDLYRITATYIHPVSNFEPRFNVAPMQRGVVVQPDKEGRREPVMMRWGLVPSWSKDDKAETAPCFALCASQDLHRSIARSRIPSEALPKEGGGVSAIA